MPFEVAVCVHVRVCMFVCMKGFDAPRAITAVATASVALRVAVATASVGSEAVDSEAAMAAAAVVAATAAAVVLMAPADSMVARK